MLNSRDTFEHRMESVLRLRGFGNYQCWCWYSQMIIVGSRTDLGFQRRAWNLLPVPPRFVLTTRHSSSVDSLRTYTALPVSESQL
jgi:hypothetical protein